MLIKSKARILVKTAMAAGFALISTITVPPIAVLNHVSAQENAFVNENFNSIADGQLPKGWKLRYGNASVQKGKLLLESSSYADPAQVTFPVNTSSGDYIFEADLTYKTAINDSRWASIMFRIQPDHTYYQFAVRKNTKSFNGMEFAKKNEIDSWQIIDSTFFPLDIEFEKTYRLKIVASKNRVQQFIDNKLVIDTGRASLRKGYAGFQANGTTVEFDNVKVTQANELPSIGLSGPFTPSGANTNIINAPVIISSATSLPVKEGTSQVLLPIAVNSKNQLMTGKIPLINSLNEVKNKWIPLLQVEKAGLIEPLIHELNQTHTIDYHVVSSDPKVLQAFKEKAPLARTALYYKKQEMGQSELKELALLMNRTGTRTVIMPEGILSSEAIHYLHSRMISVWGEGAETLKTAHELLSFGTDGIIAKNPGYMAEALKQYPDHTIFQRPIVAAHRGVPSQAPENTMASFKKAFELGADLIETDIHATKDGHLVLIHDGAVNRTTAGTGKVRDFTLEELKALDAGSKYSYQFTGEKIPELRELLQEFKGKNVVLLLEVKEDGIEESLIKAIEEADMADQIVIQSFDMNHLEKIHALKPEIGTGYLYEASSAASSSSRLKKAEQMLQFGTAMNVTLNASYSSLNQEFITYMRQRGMLNMHWTYRNQADLQQNLLGGVLGSITDYAQWFSDSPIKLEVPVKKIDLNLHRSSSMEVQADLDYRGSRENNIRDTALTSDNESVVKIEGSTIKAVSPGKAYVFVNHPFETTGFKWNLASEPIEVTVTE